MSTNPSTSVSSNVLDNTLSGLVLFFSPNEESLNIKCGGVDDFEVRVLGGGGVNCSAPMW